MNKPSTIIYEEFKQGLANLINNSGLPAFVIELILRDYANEVKIVSNNQYEMDKSKYEGYLSGCAETQTDNGSE